MKRNQIIGASIVVAIVATVSTIFGIRLYKRNKIVHMYMSAAKILNDETYLSDAAIAKKLPYSDIKNLYTYYISYVSKNIHTPSDFNAKITKIFTDSGIHFNKVY